MRDNDRVTTADTAPDLPTSLADVASDPTSGRSADHRHPPQQRHSRTRNPTPSRLYPRVTSFRSRRGALTGKQQASWDRLWTQIGREVDDTPLDTDTWFGRHAPLVVEIGCGTGSATAALAQAEPDLDVLAIEVYQPGLAQLVGAIEREQIPNIRLVRGDGVDVLTTMLSPASLTGVRVFFPDPWPKTRHHKRRLLQPATLSLIADRLRPGGLLHVATDHREYAEHIAGVGDAEPRLRRLQVPGNKISDIRSKNLPISVNRPTTKFESKAHRAGSTITEFLWCKIEQ